MPPVSSSSSKLSPPLVPLQTGCTQPISSRGRTCAGTTAALMLPSLPRFHPVNFVSRSPNAEATMVEGPSSSQSSQACQKPFSEAQRHLYYYQRKLLSRAASENQGPTAVPTSPHLIPTASPGPITPLDLERAKSYFATSTKAVNVASCSY